MKATIYSVIPKVSPMKLDIMEGDIWLGQVTLPCQVGVGYDINELKAYARIKKPSLEGKDFELIPTAHSVFK